MASLRTQAWATEQRIAAALERGLEGGKEEGDEGKGRVSASIGTDVVGVGGEEEEERVYYEPQGLSGLLGSTAMHFGRRDPVLTCTYKGRMCMCVCVWKFV